MFAQHLELIDSSAIFKNSGILRCSLTKSRVYLRGIKTAIGTIYLDWHLPLASEILFASLDLGLYLELDDIVILSDAIDEL